MLQAGVIQKKAVMHLGATEPKAKPVDVATVKVEKKYSFTLKHIYHSF